MQSGAVWILIFSILSVMEVPRFSYAKDSDIAIREKQAEKERLAERKRKDELLQYSKNRFILQLKDIELADKNGTLRESLSRVDEAPDRFDRMFELFGFDASSYEFGKDGKIIIYRRYDFFTQKESQWVKNLLLKIYNHNL